jgi:hypothetical protein
LCYLLAVDPKLKENQGALLPPSSETKSAIVPADSTSQTLSDSSAKANAVESKIVISGAKDKDTAPSSLISTSKPGSSPLQPDSKQSPSAVVSKSANAADSKSTVAQQTKMMDSSTTTAQTSTVSTQTTSNIASHSNTLNSTSTKSPQPGSSLQKPDVYSDLPPLLDEMD